MTLIKDISQYNDNEIEIISRITNYSKNIITQENGLKTIDYFLVDDDTNIDDFKFIINNLKNITKIYIKGNKCFDILIETNSNFNIKNILNINDINNLNSKKIEKIFNKFPNITNLVIEKSVIDCNILDVKNVEELTLIDNKIKNLDKIVTNNIINFTIENSEYKYIKWENRGHTNLYILALDGVKLNPLNNIDYVEYIYYEKLNIDEFLLNNILKVKEIVLNSINSKKIDISKINYNYCEIKNIKTDILLLNSKSDNIIDSRNCIIDKINILKHPFMKQFINYYNYVINSIQNSELNNIKLYNYLKFLNKHKNIYLKYKDTIDLSR